MIENPCAAIGCNDCCQGMVFYGIRVREAKTLIGNSPVISLPSPFALKTFSCRSDGIGWFANWNKWKQTKLATVDTNPERKLTLVINDLCPRHQGCCLIHSDPNLPSSCRRLIYASPACKEEQLIKSGFIRKFIS